MPLMPDFGPQDAPALGASSRGLTSRPHNPLNRWVAAFIALVALAVGLFLTIAPWEDNWSFNYIQELSPSLRELWEDPAFRGAISGLGFANLLIAVLEAVRAFSRR